MEAQTGTRRGIMPSARTIAPLETFGRRGRALFSLMPGAPLAFHREFSFFPK